LSKGLQQALQDPDLQARLAGSGAKAVSPDRATPEALRTFLQAEVDKWVPIIQKAGVKVN